MKRGALYREAAWAVVVTGMGGSAGARPAPPARMGRASLSMARPRLPAIRGEWRSLKQAARDNWEALVVALACGPLAEARVTGDPPEKTCAGHLTQVFDALVGAGLPQKGAVELVADWAKQARAVLDNPATWAAVERVAAELEERGSLSPGEVKALMAAEVGVA